MIMPDAAIRRSAGENRVARALILGRDDSVTAWP